MRSLPDPSGFVGAGWFGALGYQLGRRLERLPAAPIRPRPAPDLRLGWYPQVLRFDEQAGAWWFEALHARDDAAAVEIERRHDETLRRWSRTPDRAEPTGFTPFRMRPDAATHCDVVRRGLGHITAGDVFQVNLCLRLDASFTGNPLDAHLQGVRDLRPAWSAFVGTRTGAVASLSPELFLRRSGRRVVTSPIKGTAPLTADPDQLAASAKDAAENVMIVDLMRNDLSRVAVPGTVQVPAQARVEEHAGVWHLLRDVTAVLRDDVDDAALITATFPPGSVTGAPKIRAMELICELEATAREAYTGAVGWLGPRGAELNVAIRTLEFEGSQVWMGVGGGIVAASSPARELGECRLKAAPILRAVGADLDPDEWPDHSAPPADHPVAADARTPLSPLPHPGEGVFETLLAVDGTPHHLDQHLGRLAAGVEATGGALPHGLRGKVVEHARRTEGRVRMRVDVAPGAGGEQIRTAPAGTPPEALRLLPFQVPGGWGPHKWADRSALPEADLARSGRVHDELLLLDGDELLETARGSLFLVDDDGVHTPALDGRILPGTARARVIHRLRTAGITVVEGRLTQDRLTTAAEAFVTNAVRGVVPVTGADTGFGARRQQQHPGASIVDWLDTPEAPRSRPADRRPISSRVLLVDNYDSFVYNLSRYCAELGAEPVVLRNDDPALRDPAGLAAVFDHVVISPGPGRPADAGESVPLVRALAGVVPVLGICLGHQAIGEAFGGVTIAAPTVVHGSSSLVLHDGRGVFVDEPPLMGGRYHSLVVDQTRLPGCLERSAWTPSGLLMGLRHRELAVHGVQLHPESVLTTRGRQVIATFLRTGMSG